MRNYEVTFIVDPVLSGDEIKKTAQTYIDQLEQEGCKITNIDEMGLLTLAYSIKKRNSGVYYCVEFEAVNGAMIDKIELALRRDERIIRFLTVSLDKFGVKYNDDKRNGKIGKTIVKKKEVKEDAPRGRRGDAKPKAKPAPKPKEAAKVVAETPATPEEKAPVKTEEAPVKEEAPKVVAETPVAPAADAPATTEETTEKDA